jgi:hypothetical protein
MKTISINKQKQLPKGFLSTDGKPTGNALMMFFIYWSCVPKDWNKNQAHIPSVDVVRNHFGVNYGFENMIRWGIQHGCCKSKTSSGRHNSMSQACVVAQAAIGAGIVMSPITMKSLMDRAA